jgi:hypothetical protein
MNTVITYILEGQYNGDGHWEWFGEANDTSVSEDAYLDYALKWKEARPEMTFRVRKVTTITKSEIIGNTILDDGK